MRLNITRLCAVLIFSSVIVFAGTAGAQGIISGSVSYTSATGTIGTNATIQITINSVVDLSNVVFTYNAPAGLTVTSALTKFQSLAACNPVSSFTANSVSLTQMSVAGANNTCIIQFTVMPTAGGVFTALPQLSSFSYTGFGGSPMAFTAGANPTLTVPTPAAVPALSQWALMLLGVSMAGGGAIVLYKRRAS